MEFMYKHILLPTDDSELSRRAAREGIRLAQTLGARVTALYVTAPFSRDYEQSFEEAARRALDAIDQAARTANVVCTALHRIADSPSAEIIEVARERDCDLVFMASHGRRGMRALLLGSETNKVLTHSKIPVLVCR
jgi:nucleotide-binding universal stress UspA family protein